MFIDFRKRGKEKREKERNIDVGEKHRSVASHTCPSGGSNPQPFVVWDDALTTEQPGRGPSYSERHSWSLASHQVSSQKYLKKIHWSKNTTEPRR